MNVRLNVTPPQAQIPPGGEGTASVSVANTSNVVRAFHLNVLGVTGWAFVDPPELRLFPDTYGEAIVHVRPPRSSEVLAGQHSFAVRAVATDDPEVAAVEEGSVEVGSFAAATAKIRPKTARAHRTATYRLSLTNTGNAPQRFDVDAADDDEMLDLVVNPAALALEPGASSTVKIRAKMAAGHVPRGERLPFEATVRARDMEPLTATGALAVGAPVGAWVGRIAVPALVLALAVGGLIAFRNREPRTQARETGVVPTSAVVPADLSTNPAPELTTTTAPGPTGTSAATSAPTAPPVVVPPVTASPPTAKPKVTSTSPRTTPTTAAPTTQPAAATGTPVAWGRNLEGQATLPAGLSRVVAVAAGAGHSLALKPDGTVVAWGWNAHGETTVPAGLSGVVAIAAGNYHSLALKGDGTVVAWGIVDAGQPPAGLSNVVAIAAGGAQSLALKGDGTVVAWGGNLFGEAAVPAGLSNVVAVAAGGYHSLALKRDGTVVAWGGNDYGQAAVPSGLSNVVAIAAGGAHSMALKGDGTVRTWGRNNYGQTAVPAGLSNVAGIAAGFAHSMALKGDGTVVAWGYNNYGQATVPAGLSNVMKIAAGSGGNHSLAIVRQ